jgi:ornithine cyclodeaminase
MPLSEKKGFLAQMPSASAELESYGTKLISIHPSNRDSALPVIQGIVCLFDLNSGKPIAIVDAGEITGIRTAAASGLATLLLARENSTSCGIFGCGIQAVTHIDAMRAVRPIERFLIWGRNLDKLEQFSSEQQARTGIEVVATPDPEEAAQCDILCTVTSSAEPILNGDWVKPGAHINLVGAHSLTTREADTTLISKAAVYVDLMESVRNEGGDIMIPINEGAIDESHIKGEIGQLVLDEITGRVGEDQITLYKSLGVATQDLYAADYVLAKAVESNTGGIFE